MCDIRGTLGDGEFGYLVTDVVVGENRSGSDGDGIGTIGERTDAACASGKHMYTDQRRVVLGRSNDTANRDAPPLGPGRVMNTKGKRISVVEFLIFA